MWHPPDAVRHSLPAAEWPTAEQAATSRWFSAIDVGPVRLATRTWVPAMVPWRATESGFVTDDVLAWYERFARGRPGGLVVEATGVREVPSGPLLRIGDDRFIPGLSRLVATVKEASNGETRVFIQILDFLAIKRRPPRDVFLQRYLTITPHHRAALAGIAATDAEIRDALVRMDDVALAEVLSSRERDDLAFGYRERVTDTHLSHIRDLPLRLPGIFAAAARRACAAGFDGVELHYAHAYTMASFLSRLNTRTDGYGGTIGERLRLPLETLAAVRCAVPRQSAVGCRILADECIAGGSDVAEAAIVGRALANAGADFISLSRGGKFEDARQPKVGAAAYPYTGPSGWECMPTVLADAAGPFGRNVAPAARIRHAIRRAGLETPIVVSGGIGTFHQAEAILASGEADIVGAARQALADPDWLVKVRRGRGADVRRCVYTNYCEGLDQMHKQVTCKLWDRLRLDEPGVMKSADGKRRLLAPDWIESPASASAAGVPR